MKLLRLVLVAYASICLVGSVILILSQKGTWTLALGVYLLINSVVIFAGSVFERRYKSNGLPKADWKPTGERFIDDKSGNVVEVYFNPKTGERSYIDSEKP